MQKKSKESKSITPRSQKNDNFIDKTFTILADILLQTLPTTKREREASTGMVRFDKVNNLPFFHRSWIN